MSKKKKNKAPAAQQLIDSLLDENTSAARKRPGFDSTSVGSSDDESIDFSEMDSGDIPEEIILEDGRPMRVRNETFSGERPGVRDESVVSGFSGDESVHLSFEHPSDSTQAQPSQASHDDDGDDVPEERTNVIPFTTQKKDLNAVLDRSAETYSAMDSDSPSSADDENRLSSQDAEALELSKLIPLDEEEEKTMRIPPPLAPSSQSSNEELFPEDDENRPSPRQPIDRSTATEIRPGGRPFGSSQAKRSASGPAVSSIFTSAEAALKQSESLRIAQSRITDLEQELERLRRENEKLASAGETLRRRSDELISKIEGAEAQSRESQRILEEEKRVIRGQLTQKDRENADLRQRLDEMENRLESNFKKIRVRERELEHRLEIIKMESATLVSTKDKMILELKRQVDQLTHESDYSKQKSQEMFNQYKDKQETIRRVVRALRIALTILEGDDENNVPFKKTE